MAGTHNTPEAQDYLKRLSEQLNKKTRSFASRASAPAGSPDGAVVSTPKRIDISDELARAQRIKNDDAEQNITLKKVVLNRLFRFLGIETFFIFVFVLLQATHWIGFGLEEWTFNILITATIAQITGMLLVAVRYLFPAKKDE